MNSSINFSKCSLHNGSGIMFDRNEKSPEKKINCLRCLAQSNQNLIPVQDILDDQKEIIQMLVQEKVEQNHKTISILQEIIRIQNEIKNNTIAQVDKNISNLNKEIKTLNEGFILFSNFNLDVQNSKSIQQIFDQASQQTTNAQKIIQVLGQQLVYLEFQESKLQISKQISEIQTQNSDQVNDMIQNLGKLLNAQSNYENINCQQHNQKGVMIDLNENSTILGRIACLDCLKSQKIAFTKLEDFNILCQKQQQEKKQLIELSKTYYLNKTGISYQLFYDYNLSIQNQLIKVLQELQYLIDEYSNQLQKEQNINTKDIQNLSQKELIELADQISNLKSLDEYQNKIQLQSETQIRKFSQTLNQTYINQLQLINGFYSQIYKIEMCEKNYDIERIGQKKKLGINSNTINLQVSTKKKTEAKIPQNKCKNTGQNIEYQQISTIQQEQWCFAISFYHDASQMVLGSNKQIKVFNNQNGQFSLNQTINQGHTGNVQCLKYMNNSQRFVSGGQDKLIIVWSLDDKQQYFCEQKLNGHSFGVTCLDFNKLENLLISGSTDEKVRFWTLKYEWNISDTYIDHNKQVQALSLSENQQLLVSCCNETILVHKLIDHDNLKLEQIQKITSQFPIYRISFINNNTFIFQSSKSTLQFYIQENDSQNFIQKEQIDITNTETCSQYSPSIYLKDQGLLLFKSGQNIYILKRMNDQQFIIYQKMQFQGFQTVAAISQNAQYLSIWNKELKEIQIRKLI